MDFGIPAGEEVQMYLERPKIMRKNNDWLILQLQKHKIAKSS